MVARELQMSLVGSKPHTWKLSRTFCSFAPTSSRRDFSFWLFPLPPQGLWCFLNCHIRFAGGSVRNKDFKGRPIEESRQETTQRRAQIPPDWTPEIDPSISPEYVLFDSLLD